MSYQKSVKRCEEAWERAYSALARQVNQLSMERGFDLELKEGDNLDSEANPVAVFRQASDKFNKYLARLDEQLEDIGIDSETLRPWQFGHFGLPLEDPATELCYYVDTLRQKTKEGKYVLEWTQEDWASKFVESMVQHAHTCREWFVALPNRLGKAQTVCDPITLKEAAKLLSLTKKTLSNRKSTSPPPEPAVKASGRSPDTWSYGTLRTWLCKNWPDRAAMLPEAYEQARKRLISG